jgi:ABC-type transport system involved in cytochrome c biogenesis permease subunit
MAAVRLLEQASADRGNPDRLAAHLAALNAVVRELAADNRQVAQIPLENFLYRLQPFYYSLVLYVAVFLLAALSWLAPARRWPYRLSVIALAFPLALHTAGIVLRCVIRARPPVTTLYETLLFIAAVAAACALVLECVTRRRVAVAMGAFLGAVGLFLASRYEAIDGRDTMPSLIAVLDTNFWLATHVTTITIGYAAGLLAGALAHLYLFGKALGWKRDDAGFYRHLTRMVYGVLCFGLLFATVGTVLGGIWANESWGRFWGWDPKENGALMIVLWGLAVLHARLGGYIRDFGINMAALFGGIIVAFSWFGVNMLGVGLHSYGFTSGIHRALTTFYLIEMAALMVGGFAWLREQEIVRVEPADGAQD